MFEGKGRERKKIYGDGVRMGMVLAGMGRDRDLTGETGRRLDEILSPCKTKHFF